MDHIFDVIMFKWQNATITDYVHVVLAIIILGYFIARAYRE